MSLAGESSHKIEAVFLLGPRGFLWVWIMGSQNVVGLGYGSNTSELPWHVYQTKYIVWNLHGAASILGTIGIIIMSIVLRRVQTECQRIEGRYALNLRNLEKAWWTERVYSQSMDRPGCRHSSCLHSSKRSKESLQYDAQLSMHSCRFRATGPKPHSFVGRYSSGYDRRYSFPLRHVWRHEGPVARSARSGALCCSRGIIWTAVT